MTRGARCSVWLLIGGVAAGACKGYKPSEGAASHAQYVVITKIDPPPFCQLRGSVSSEEQGDEAYRMLQEKAVELGATHVVLDGTRAKGITWGYRVKSETFGRAYWCPPQPPPQYYSAPPPPPPAAAVAPSAPGGVAASTTDVQCSPACGDGYICSNGNCAPQCNPACAAGETCGSDRVCRPAH